MADPTLYNGTTTITFKLIEQFTPTLKTSNMEILPLPEGEGQISVDIGAKGIQYTLKWLLVDDDPLGVTAWGKWENWEAMFFEEGTKEWQVRVQFDKPDGTGTKTIQGKLLQVIPDVVMGRDVQDLAGTMVISWDNNPDSQH